MKKGRKDVNCTWCNKSINRQIWNYGKNRPIEIFFCDNVCKGSWQKNQRELLGFTKEWLISEYHEKRKSANQIAREVGRDTKRVWEWIRDYGIETRPRGTDYGNLFIKGQESAFKGMIHTEETKENLKKISLKDGRVPFLKDGKHWLQHDDAVHPNWKGGVTPDRQAVYSSEEWVDAVKEVWARDNATCQRCTKKHNTKEARGTFHIHHIVSFMVKPLRTEPSNLILLCRPCHLWVHSNKNENNHFIEEYHEG